MSISKSTNTYNRQNWEDSDFPILCQTCLGDNPYIRMSKEKYGKECKICARPFTVFRWCPGRGARFKKTEVCQTCAKIKNVCQTCLLDLEYGLPTQVRDAALSVTDDIPKSDVNKEYFNQNIESQLANTDGSTAAGAIGKTKAQSDLLLRLARTTPYYKRNRPHICSFWVKGECKRGEECPFRHERPTDPDDPLADQNIKDRYYGVNDPVAEKLMRRANALPGLVPPEDKSITTLYVGNLGENIGEKELTDHFYQHGEIRSISLVPKHRYAFIQFATRSGAELAAEKSFNKLTLGNRRLNIKWGKSQGRPNQEDERNFESDEFLPVQTLPGLPNLPPLPNELQKNYFNLGDPSFGQNIGQNVSGPPPGMHHRVPPPFPPGNLPPGLRPPGFMPPPPPFFH